MAPPATYIVSDLHLGSEHFRHRQFLSWLDSLPAESPLILNGDTVDDPRKPIPAVHREVLERMVAESRRRPYVWVYGNHDAGYVPEDSGQIQFAHYWEVERRLLVVHGDDFDDVMPKHGLFKAIFKTLHKVRRWLGFQNVHVAEYAKKWDFLYRVLNNRVAQNALDAARLRGFDVITCGHTHTAMDVRDGGVRYLNTGAWTETPLFFLEVNGEGFHLREFSG